MKHLKKMIYILLFIVAILGIATFIITNLPQFGKLPSGERFEKIKKNPQYRDGKFHNLSPTPQMTSDDNVVKVFWDYFFKKKENLKPNTEIPAVKTNLHNLKKDENILVWLGHSSYFLQVEGKRFLIDPVCFSASPFSFMMKPFKGSDLYQPEDIPAIDYLIITHDHWDHLDYKTIKEILPRVSKVVTHLGVGEHLEYWGFQPEQITELSWWEEISFGENIKITSLPTRHFSGRGLRPTQTLWGSFMLQTEKRTLYLGGDSGYDSFFKTIGEKFPQIDLAIMENGQYDKNWKYIHFQPDDLVKVIKDLNPKRILAFHNSKFALANHTWNEPLENISKTSEENGFNLSTPMIGEVVDLDNLEQKFGKWWKGL